MIFKKRKIVIVSGERIVSYSVGTAMQSLLLTCLLTVMGGAGFALAGGALRLIPASPFTQVAALPVAKKLEFTQAAAPVSQAETEQPEKDLAALITEKEDAAIKRAAQLEQELAKTSERLKNMVMLAESLSLVADATPGGKRYGFSKTGIPVPHLRDPAKRAPLPPHERSAIEKREGELYARLRTGIRDRMRHIGEGLSLLAPKYIADSKLKAVRDGKELAQGGPYVPENLKTASEAFEISSDLVSLATVRDRLAALPIGMPLANYRVTGSYGPRTDPINGRRAVHYGLDMSAGYGAKVYATAGGTIKRAGRVGAYGNLVEISHPNGYSTRFGHLAKVAVKPGQRIKQGQLIGFQGNTGRSTGTHLHYEVRYRNVAVNPYNFLKAGKYVF